MNEPIIATSAIPTPSPVETKFDMNDFTTPQQMEEYEDLLRGERVFVKKGTRDRKTMHKIVHMYPVFKGSTGEDPVSLDHGKEAVHCNYAVVVQQFREEVKGGQKTKVQVGSFNMDARKFLAQYETDK